MEERKNIEGPFSPPSGAGVLVTGAAGFIGSCMVQYLNELGYENLILVDDFGVEEKRKNWEGKKYETIVERYNLFAWLEENNPSIAFVVHLGARTDTTEFDYAIHQELNVEYSQDIWNYCTEKQVPLIYASSAATYGNGEFGYDDDQNEIGKLQPLNPYGISKNEFDKWAIRQQWKPPFWAGLKFFNVYGPNEYHKARMASVIFHAFNQIKKHGIVKLFKSHKKGFEDGKQLRDFVYVKDVVKVIAWMMTQSKMADDGWQTPDSKKMTAASLPMTDEKRYPSSVRDQPSSLPTQLSSGIYNLGTGQSRTFEDLVKATFSGLDLEAQIQFIDMPADIREKYQYFTEANMKKLRDAGYSNDFYSLEEGVEDYVRNYLSKSKIY